MKVAYFLGSLNRGGTEMLILDICRNHNIAPYEMLLIYRNEGNMSNLFRDTGVQMFRIKPEKFRYISYMLKLRQLLSAEEVDILHAQTLMNGLTSVFLLLGTKIRLITTFHGLFFGKLQALYYHIVMWGSDATFYVSDSVRHWYVQRTWCNHDKFYTVYNGVNFNKFDDALPNKEISSQSKRIRLAMVGSFVQGRSQIVIAKAIKRLVEIEAISNIDFYFIGRKIESNSALYDDCVKYCVNHHLDNIYFLGDRSDVPSLLKSMDGYVYSTVSDTFGISVVEAMAVGLPVVVNDWPVMKEVCSLNIPSSDNVVRFFKTGNVDDCAHQIANLVATLPQSRSEAIIHAQGVRRLFSIEKHIEKSYEIYKFIAL